MASSEINVEVGGETRTPVEAPGPSTMSETPSEAPGPAPISETPSSPLDFDFLTLSQLGISTQSFLPSSHCKNKSRLAQLKQRRRSSVGVRGSPETNSLIRYQAQQRMKTPATTPESIRASPSLPRFNSSLKQKMASFQSLVDVKENECLVDVKENEMLGTPSGQDNLIGRFIKTRDYLSDGRSQDCRKENCDPETAPPVKRRCTAPIGECAEEIRGVNAPILRHSPLKPHKVAVLQDRVQLAQPVTPRAQAENDPGDTGFVSPQPAVRQVPVCESKPSSLTHFTPTKEQLESLFEVKSPSPAQANNSLPSRPADPPVFVMPSVPELNPSDCGDRPGNSTAKKQKRVRFGAALSPEYFDKTLPPSTPLHRGSTPARAATSTAGSQLRSLLKTPQRSEQPAPPPAPDLTSPSLAGGSPLLSMGPCGSTDLGGEGDGAYTLKTIAFPTLEDSDSSMTDNTAAEINLEIQTLDLNTAFQEDSVTETLLVDPAPVDPAPVDPAPVDPAPVDPAPVDPAPVDPAPVDPAPETEPVSEPAAALEPGPQSEPEDTGTTAPPSGPASSKNRKRKRTISIHHSDTQKPTDEEEPVRRSTRVAASGNRKGASEKRGWSKKVNLLLYPSREYASKTPALSPVTETLCSASRSPTPDHRQTRRHTAEEEEEPAPLSSVDRVIDGDPVIDAAAATALRRRRFCPSTNDTPAHTLGTADPSALDPCEGASDSRPRTPAAKIQARGGRRKVSVPSDSWLSEEPAAAQEGPVSGPSNLGTTDTSSSDPCDGASEAPVDPCAGTSERAIRSGRKRSGSGPKTPAAKIQARGGRRKVSVYSDDCLSEKPEHTEDPTTNPEVPMSGPSKLTEAPAEQDTIREADSLTSPSDVDACTEEPQQQLVRRVKSRRASQHGSRGRINAVTEDRAQEDTAQANELPPGEEGEEQQHPASREEEDSGRQRSEESAPSLLPWQLGDFNIEDVLRPAASSRRNPVRRSLRNQRGPEEGKSAGLAWLPRTSPDSIREIRRRSRSRRSTGHCPQWP